MRVGNQGENMFGFQHEQASKCEGCTKIEVCGKKQIQE